MALLSDAQCGQLREFANGGGSLLATFESGCYDESGRRRPDSGLADLFGTRSAGKLVAPNGNAAYARIERDHAILAGFRNTNLLPFAEYYLPLRAVANPVLTVLPPFPAYPPEMVYPAVTHTDQPAVVLAERGLSRIVYLPGDIDRAYWRSQNPDLSRLLGNAIRWMQHDAAPITVTGDGMAELFAWKTQPGFAIHILNYNNPAMQRGWFIQASPLPSQKLRFELPPGARFSSARLLRSGRELTLSRNGNSIEMTIPSVADYEVVALV